MLLQEMNIDYELLHKAILYYKNLGYKQIEVPWLVSEDASLFTAPSKEHVYITDRNEHLVGSAEQGFVHLFKYHPEKIEPNQFYFSVSPCFRRDTLDETHSNTFMKLELFCYPRNMSGIDVFSDFIRHARKLFQSLSGKEIETVQGVDDAMDLQYNGLELGSYGSRGLKDDPAKKWWVYGTGLALPRFQLIMEPEHPLNVNDA